MMGVLIPVPQVTSWSYCRCLLPWWRGWAKAWVTAKSSHTITVTRFQLSLPMVYLSSPGLYSPDPMPGSLFPRHLHFSCLPAWLVACLFYISPFVPSIPHLCHFNSQPSDTKTFISLILQFPIIMYTDFSTVAHSFTIPYFDQFKKYNRHISWSSWFKMVVSYAINTKEKDSPQRQLWLWLLPNSKKRKSLHFLC